MSHLSPVPLFHSSAPLLKLDVAEIREIKFAQAKPHQFDGFTQFISRAAISACPTKFVSNIWPFILLASVQYSSDWSTQSAITASKFPVPLFRRFFLSFITKSAATNLYLFILFRNLNTLWTYMYRYLSIWVCRKHTAASRTSNNDTRQH